MGVVLIILLIIFVAWPWISKWLGQLFRWYMARKTEDMMRRMMGMPSRKEEKARAQSRRKEEEAQSRNRRKTSSRHRYHRPPRQDAATLLRSVAEDVEYTEVREFESTHIAADRGTEHLEYDEEQVSDAEFTEIKKKS